MDTFLKLSIIIITLKSLKSDDDFYSLPRKPENCLGDQDVMDRKCCVLPPFFTRTIAKTCGATFSMMDIDQLYNVTTIRRYELTGCSHWECVLTKYYLLTSEKKLNLEKYFSHLDKWVELNPEFESPMFRAKTYCKSTIMHALPLDVCEFFHFNNCIRNYLTVYCPRMIPTPKCDELKAFYEECAEYFLK